MSASARPDSGAVTMTVASCNGSPEAEVVSEDVDAVRVAVQAFDDSDEACADGADVCLTAPLGDRTLIDDSTGDAVAVETQPSIEELCPRAVDNE